MSPSTKSFFHKATFTWTHLVWDPATGQAVVIDPVLDYVPSSGRTATDSAAEVVEFAVENSLRVRYALETHAHADHMTAAAWFKSQTGCEVGIGKGICGVQETFRKVYNLGADLEPDGSQFDLLLSDGDRLPLGELEIRVMATPGHTDDSVTYVIGEHAFIGDTMFNPTLGTARCDFPGGDARRLFRSLQSILDLGDDTTLYLCHDYPPQGEDPLRTVTCREARSRNIHLADNVDEDEFVRRRTERDAQLSMPALILPSIQVNIRAGELPAAEDNGVSYLKMPLNAF